MIGSGPEAFAFFAIVIPYDPLFACLDNEMWWK